VTAHIDARRPYGPRSGHARASPLPLLFLPRQATPRPARSGAPSYLHLRSPSFDPAVAAGGTGAGQGLVGGGLRRGMQWPDGAAQEVEKWIAALARWRWGVPAFRGRSF
jgi:hypothetical protein